MHKTPHVMPQFLRVSDRFGLFSMGLAMVPVELLTLIVQLFCPSFPRKYHVRYRKQVASRLKKQQPNLVLAS